MRRCPISRMRPRSCSRGPVHMVFGVDEPFEGTLESTCREFCDRTRDYWMEWVRRLAFSIDWQDEIIRAGDHAQAVQLRGDRRDRGGAYHIDPGSAGLGAQLGLSLLLDARRLLRGARAQPHRRDAHDGRFHLLYPEHRDRPRRHGASRSTASCTPISLEERTAEALAGYRGDGPVRIGNAAVESGPARRLWQHHHGGDADVLRPPAAAAGRRRAVPVLEPLGEQAAKLALEPDAGIWEYRGRKRVHTHSAAMCWAGCQRLEAIAAHLGLADRAALLGRHANRIGEEVLKPRLESQAQGLFGGLRQRRSRRQLRCCWPNSA